jgi:hypothetical protein
MRTVIWLCLVLTLGFAAGFLINHAISTNREAHE